MNSRICSSFSPTSPYPGGNWSDDCWPWNDGGWAALGANGGSPGGGPKRPGALEGGFLARIAGLGVDTGSESHRDFLGNCFLASSMMVSPRSFCTSSAVLPSSSSQPLFLHSVWKTKALAASLVNLGKSPKISLGAASKCLSKMFLVMSFKWSWLNLQLSASSMHRCPVWKYLQGKPLCKYKHFSFLAQRSNK